MCGWDNDRSFFGSLGCHDRLSGEELSFLGSRRQPDVYINELPPEMSNHTDGPRCFCGPVLIYCEAHQRNELVHFKNEEERKKLQKKTI